MTEKELDYVNLCAYYGVTNELVESYLNQGQNMPAENFHDHEVVAAFNSCIDLKKFNELPHQIKVRLKNLFLHHRMKMVCFFPADGFGLRLYHDFQKYTATIDGDEATLVINPGVLRAQVDDDGVWVRCPGSVWTDRKPPEPVKEYVIVDQKAKKFYDGDRSGEVGDWWTSYRDRAIVYKDKLVAQAAAQDPEINGIVVEK